MFGQTVDRALRWWARDRGDQPAIWLGDDTLTYAELDDWTGRAAASLAADGLEVGQRVVFYAETSLDWCAAAFATIRCGGIVAPINSRMVASEVQYLMGRYEPSRIFIDPEGADRLNRSGLFGEERVGTRPIEIPALAALRKGSHADVKRPIDADAAVAIITTSGSTAHPKGVVFSHRALADFAVNEAVASFSDITGKHFRTYTPAPLATSAGFNVMAHSVIIGGTVCLQTQFDALAAIQAIQTHKINAMRAAPIFYQRMAEHPSFETADLSSLATATCGGAAPAPWLLEAWWRKGVVLKQLYGQTEAGGRISENPVRYAKSDPERCGYGAAVTEVAILDENGNILPADTPGEIAARGPGMMTGYWRDPEATANAFRNGWLHTGDIGEVDSRGLLKMRDRMKDIIRSGGFTISSAELERVIAEVPGVLEVAIIATPDEKFGETPLAIVYGADPSISAIIAHCGVHLAGYKVPRRVIVSPEPLPRLAMGKISKPALRNLYADIG